MSPKEPQNEFRELWNPHKTQKEQKESHANFWESYSNETKCSPQRFPLKNSSKPQKSIHLTNHFDFQRFSMLVNRFHVSFNIKNISIKKYFFGWVFSRALHFAIFVLNQKNFDHEWTDFGDEFLILMNFFVNERWMKFELMDWWSRIS